MERSVEVAFHQQQSEHRDAWFKSNGFYRFSQAGKIACSFHSAKCNMRMKGVFFFLEAEIRAHLLYTIADRAQPD